MELADATAHRALAYLTAAQRNGYVMTVDELDAYMRQPGRRPGTSGTPGRPERKVVTTNFGRAMQQMTTGFAEQMLDATRAVTDSMARSLGTEIVVVPATPGTPPKPAESVVAWLERLHWIDVSDRRIRTTGLGDAMYRHLERASGEEDVPIGVVLDQGDELATARVVQQLAGLGRCSLVDSYFSIESLQQIVESTEVDAVLMGTRDKSKLAGIETALATVPFPRSFEVRKSDVFHDRFVIPESGPIWLLGTSLTGLAKRLSVMVQLDDAIVAGSIRSQFSAAWDTAVVVGRAEPMAQGTTAADETAAG